MEFEKYQHIERYGTPDVEGIELGMCYIFPKIDGTNASLWCDDNGIQAGSRNRHLTLDKDNAGFCEWAINNDNINKFFKENKKARLYGEWLVPHSLKTYSDSAWRKFYVFDVKDGNGRLATYVEYSVILDEYGIDYIPPLCTICNPNEYSLHNALDKNTYLIKDNEGVGEGIVVKNYEYRNKYGRQTWAKIVRNEFKEMNHKVFGAPEIKATVSVEEKIVNKYVTGSLVEKEYAKINNECGWNSKMIPRLLNTVFHCLVSEESWNYIKEYKNPVVDYKRLMLLTTHMVKEYKKELF